MRIIDCHVHARNEPDPRSGMQWLMEQISGYGIEQVIISDLGDGDGWKAFPSSEAVSCANRRSRSICASSGGRMNYLVYLNPQLDDWHRELEEHKNSAVGVKLWISLRTGENRSLERSAAVLKAASALDLPVLIHTFERTGGTLEGEIGIDGVTELAGMVPDCRIIAAHSCGNWQKTIARAAEFPQNIVFDISGIFPGRGMVKRMVETFGSERLLFGTDGPGRSFGCGLHMVTENPLPQKCLEDICFRNAERIFKLKKIGHLPERSEPPCRICFEPDEDHFCFAGTAPWWEHRISTAELAAEMAKRGTLRAFAASLDAMSSEDMLSANADWLKGSASFPVIKPLAAVDLRKTDAALKQLENISGFAGVWVSPYLHDYVLEAERYRIFWEKCAALNIPVWINAMMGEDRFRDDSLRTHLVSHDEILGFLKDSPQNTYIFQGVVRSGELCGKLPEYAFLESSRLADSGLFQFGFSGDISHFKRGSEYPFRSSDCVDRMLSGRV